MVSVMERVVVSSVILGKLAISQKTKNLFVTINDQKNVTLTDSIK